MTSRKWNCHFRVLAAAGAMLVVAMGDANAQTTRPPATPAPRSAPAPQAPPNGPPNALQGFSQNRDQPVQIESDALEVRTKDNVATFSGKVHVTQGDMDMRCQSLVVFYEDDSSKGSGIRTARPGPGASGNSQIKRLEANGGVTVVQKDQTAKGDKGIFDMRANTVTLAGNIVLTQDKNILRGERLVVDMTTGVSRVEGGRVQGLFQSNGRSENGKEGLKLPGMGAPSPPATGASPPRRN
jgi:lipopolysaccharide export system protein LptA